jgi:flagellar basal-body rod protein FlgB
MRLIERALDLGAARQRVIASNIANEETPGYRAKELYFRDALAAAAGGRVPIALAVTRSRHIGPRSDGVALVTGQVAEVPAGELPLDANSVNLDLEMAKLADNAMRYNTAATIMAQRFRQLISAIREAK